MISKHGLNNTIKVGLLGEGVVATGVWPFFLGLGVAGGSRERIWCLRVCGAVLLFVSVHCIMKNVK